MFDEKTLREREACDARLAGIERRFVERWRRIMPNYRFEDSYFARPRPADDESENRRAG